MQPDLIRPLILICLFGAIVILAERLFASMMASRAGSRAINERLKLIARYESRDKAYVNLRRVTPDYAGLPRPVAAALTRFGAMIRAAGMRTRPEVILVYMASIAAAVLAIGWMLAIALGAAITSGVLLLLVVLAISIGFALPYLYVSRVAENRRKKIVEQFPIALDIFVRSLRAGHPSFSAIRILEKELSDPLGTEFGLVSDEISYGLSLKDALVNMADRCDVEDINMFVICVSVQAETGGNLAEVLSNLATVIRDRASMYMKVRALSSEGRMTARMLTALPILTLLGLFVINPSFYFGVASDPMFVPGFLGLVISFTIGTLWIRQITNLKV
jgi:tight adherence protein B